MDNLRKKLSKRHNRKQFYKTLVKISLIVASIALLVVASR